MRTKLLCLIMALSCASPLVRGAQPADTLSLRYVFTDLDVPALDLLSRSARLDMADYAEAGKDYTAMNEMYGQSHLTAWSDSCVSLDLTQVSRAQIFLLPSAKKALAALIYTVDAGGADSQISFYDSRLRPLNAKKYFTPPLVEDFMAAQWRSDKEARAAVSRLIPFPVVEYVWDPAAHILRVMLSVRDVVSREEYKEVAPYLVAAAEDALPTLSYAWNGSRFVRLDR